MSEEIKEYEKTIQELTEINGKLHQDIRVLKNEHDKTLELKVELSKKEADLLKRENEVLKRTSKFEIELIKKENYLLRVFSKQLLKSIKSISSKQANAMLKERSKHE